MLPTGFEDILISHNIIVAVVVDVATDSKVVVGDRSTLESDYSVRIFFDDLTAEQMIQHLDGQLLPRMVQQGKVCGVICKPRETVIVGLYYHDESDVFARADFSDAIDARIQALWNSE